MWVAMARRAALVALTVFLYGNGLSPLGGCLARIEKVSVDETGVTAVLVGEAFGMAAGGRIDFDVDLHEEDLAPRYAARTTMVILIYYMPVSLRAELICLLGFLFRCLLWIDIQAVSHIFHG